MVHQVITNIIETLTPTDTEVGYGGYLYKFPLSKDRFVHFTTRSRAEEIIESGKLLFRPPYRKFGIDAVAAVSVVWGDWVPTVQATHIKVDAGEEIVAVLFKTSTMPEKYNFREEVLWKRDVMLKNPRIISFDQAKRLIQQAPEEIGEQDAVTYI